ncbi:MAG TPA: Glu-tRNA(Gln) amidotransferase subunit GatE [Candidatus Caldiarchaeum subterraneum]|uniref:Glutamyl-tRNA(Gln) amidotransferase subunit E n=1 Tax=Caldiarchaeum subterraneum TaxID=311458 RepID=A0A833A3S7_CALS0|nr:Glu-tRNA(Gln) amidotransferase subunit GatE [Candidatus Caldarchaeum subterraneum]
MEKLDYSKLGLKVGLEIHRQLNTRHKLFCECPTDAKEDKGKKITFRRYLREAQSELGAVDPAALFEAKKRKSIIYYAELDNVCLVEMDEEPPHSLNAEAVEIALTAALLMDAKPVDEIHVMRKIVIDGSNTTGFQRTCVVALGGVIKVDGKEIPIQTITLEEDAARMLKTSDREVEYDLTRLGIPLIEISTAPVITSPEEAAKAAKAIGDILRATRKVKRGLGTVRQDLNISIIGGALTEIKGVQELDLIPKVVENEVKRQLHLIEVAAKLKERGLKEDMLILNPVDVTDIFSETQSKLIRRKLSEGMRVFAQRLPRFRGLLSYEKWPGIRLGAEMAGRAKAWANVEGIFHTDELPAYGISQEEVEAVISRVAAEEMDAVVMVVSKEDKAREALEAVLQRASEALKGVPEETRAAKPDGTTVYMRPRPGAARMYPETDIPPMAVTQERLKHLRENLPPTLGKITAYISEKYGLSRQLVEQLLDKEMIEVFEEIVNRYRVQASVVAATLTETITSLKREGVQVESLEDKHFVEIFRMLSNGVFAKEAIPDILRWLANNPAESVEKAVEKLGVRSPPREELEKTIEELLEVNKHLLDDKKAINKLMGDLMRIYRGKVDGALLNQLLRQKLEEARARTQQQS